MVAEAEPGKLGILAGGGDLPGLLIESCRATGRALFVVAFEGFADAGPVEGAPHAWVDLAAVGKTLRHLHDERCEQVVMAGPVGRPSLSSLRPDLRGALLLPRVARAGGADAALKVIIAELEGEGFAVLGVEDVLADLVAEEGPLAARSPSIEHDQDIDVGIAAALELGRVDVGQAVVVQQGVVLGVEAAEGTDALIQRCGGLRMKGRGGVLVKLKKPGQERRADMPAIGVATIHAAAAAGLAGIAIGAGASLIIGRAKVAAAADEAELFVYGLPPGRLTPPRSAQ